jgi:hypothetical protein
MSEFKSRVQQVASQLSSTVGNTVQKAVTEQASRFEAAVDEVHKLQAEGLAQTGQLIGNMVRLANDQFTFAQQLAGEWQKLVLRATRSAAEAFTPKQQ